MAGLAITTDTCIDVHDRACVDVLPVRCAHAFDARKNMLFSEEIAGSGVIATRHSPNSDAIAILGRGVFHD